MIGLPALRVSGLYLALITLMLAGTITVVLAATDFPNGGSGFLGHAEATTGAVSIRRPSFAEGDSAYLRYTVIVAALMFALALWHVRGKAGQGLGDDPPERAGGPRGRNQHQPLQDVGVRPRLVHDGCRRRTAGGQRRQALYDHLLDQRLDRPARGRPHGRDLQPLGRSRRRAADQAAAGVAGQLGTTARSADDPVRPRRDPGADDRTGRPRRPVPEGHGEARPLRLAPDRTAPEARTAGMAESE